MLESTLLQRMLSGLDTWLPFWSRTDILLANIIMLLLVLLVLLFGVFLQLCRIARNSRSAAP